MGHGGCPSRGSWTIPGQFLDDASLLVVGTVPVPLGAPGRPVNFIRGVTSRLAGVDSTGWPSSAQRNPEANSTMAFQRVASRPRLLSTASLLVRAFGSSTEVSKITDLAPTTKRNGQLRSTTGLGMGDGYKSHTDKWMQPTVRPTRCLPASPQESPACENLSTLGLAAFFTLLSSLDLLSARRNSAARPF